MNYLRLTLFVSVITIIGLAGCKEEKKGLSTDMIFFEKSASDSIQNSGAPDIQFENKEFNFGRVTEGEIVKHTFTFTNKGESPLVISDVNPSCGCTTTKGWPKEPIAPGKGGEIAIEFDTNKRPGMTNKTITVITNGIPSTTVLYLKGEVVGPQQEIN